MEPHYDKHRQISGLLVKERILEYNRLSIYPVYIRVEERNTYFLYLD